MDEIDLLITDLFEVAGALRSAGDQLAATRSSPLLILTSEGFRHSQQ
jgi:hypothetical protein